MKRNMFIFFLLVFVLSFNTMFVFADDENNNDIPNDTIPDLEEVDLSSPAQVVVDITQLLTPTNNDIEENKTPDVVEVLDPQLVNVEVSQIRVSPSDTSGLKAILLTILGDYETVVTDYTYQQNNYQYLSHSIQIERDYAWLCSCGIFAILLYCTFRAIGGICARF